MGDTNKDETLILLLGKISGELKGIREQMTASDAATHRRIDDLADSVRASTGALNRRLDDHQEDTNQRFQSLEQRVTSLEQSKASNRRDAALSGGGTSALVTGAIELIRQVVG